MKYFPSKLTFLFFVALFAVTALAQKQTYDVATFTPPKGWTELKNDKAKVFSVVNKKDNKFCLFLLYPSITNHGTPVQDFAYVWKTLVQETYKASSKPELEQTTSKGFTINNGGELIEYEGTKALALLTTFSGKGKIVPMLAIMNEAAYAEEIQKLIEGIDIKIKEPVATKPDAPTTSASLKYSGNGSLADYVLETPPNWQLERKSEESVLKRDRCTISIQPMIAQNGSLESMAETVIWQVFDGWEPWAKFGFAKDYGIFERGKTAQGFDYFLVQRYAVLSSDDQIKIDAILLLIQVGNKVAVISGSQPFQNFGDGASYGLDNLLYGLHFKNVTGGANWQKELTGAWSSASGSVGLSYRFSPNGTFAFGGASQFRTSRDAYTDKVTTTSFAVDGTYKLVGNNLTITHKSTGISTPSRIRFYYTKYDKDPWYYKMGELPADSTTGRPIVYDRGN